MPVVGCVPPPYESETFAPRPEVTCDTKVAAPKVPFCVMVKALLVLFRPVASVWNVIPMIANRPVAVVVRSEAVVNTAVARIFFVTKKVEPDAFITAFLTEFFNVAILVLIHFDQTTFRIPAFLYPISYPNGLRCSLPKKDFLSSGPSPLPSDSMNLQ